MKKQILLSILALIILWQPSFAQSLMGFNDANAKKQLDLETQFDAKLNPQNLRNWMKDMSSRPCYVGTQKDKQNAIFIRDQFRAWGYDTRIDTSYVLFPTPKFRQLELVSPTTFKASLAEPALKEDATSSQLKDHLPTYNCYSADGDVTAELVFVNYGIPADYEALEKLGINVKGKIVIAKYGGSWRGIKPKVATEKGAIGCIIYSDPAGDGYGQGDVYPNGPFRSENGVQRGSVLDMPLYPGDPLTPGYGATKDAKRLDYKDAPTIMKIPVIPISYADALPLLKALGGPVVPHGWDGRLPITYHVGPGPAKVHLKLEFDFKLEPLYNVIAVMKGSEFPDQWILRGNHHDGWVFGANDPLSGMVAEMEEARAIGELAKTGWKPKRTIVFCSWDGEEPGLLGSTEWAETNQEELVKKAVVYLNSDSNARGFLEAEGAHTLEKFFNQVARDVPDPQKGVSVSERLRSHNLVNGSPEEQKEAKASGEFHIGALGSGSDFTPFLQHLGIASMSVGFGGESDGGEYHSIYDSYDDYIKFKDFDFAYGVTLAKTLGRSVLRIANADILPFEFQHFTKTVQQYGEEVKKLLETSRIQAEDNNRLVKEGRYEAAADPKMPFVQPKLMADVPFLNFAPLENALARLETSANNYAALPTTKANAAQMKQLNDILYQTERYLTDEVGLPIRPWYRHQIYAPGFYTGYGVKTLPAIREAIEGKKWSEAQTGIETISRALGKFTNQIDAATGLFAKP